MTVISITIRSGAGDVVTLDLAQGGAVEIGALPAQESARSLPGPEGRGAGRLATRRGAPIRRRLGIAAGLVGALLAGIILDGAFVAKSHAGQSAGDALAGGPLPALPETSIPPTPALPVAIHHIPSLPLPPGSEPAALGGTGDVTPHRTETDMGAFTDALRQRPTVVPPPAPSSAGQDGGQAAEPQGNSAFGLER
jgi:hypothetical protein